MALTPNSDDLDIIAALADLPNDENGLTAAEFKAKFDQGPKALKDYINNTLIPEIAAQYERQDDLTTTRKLSAAGDFTGSWHGISSPALADPGIAGSVTALQADNASRSVNVKYPPAGLTAAKGDGVTDDTAAINAIVEYLDGLGGGTIHFPQGTYILSSPIKLRSFIIYQGSGWGSIIRQKPGVVADNLFGEATPTGSVSGVVIRDLYLNGNRDNSTHPADDANGNLVRFNQVINSRIEHCYMENAKNNGISLYNSSNDNVIDNCQINDNGATSGLPAVFSLNGIFVEFGSNRNKIINSRISSNGQNGIWIGVLDADNGDNVIENNYITFNGSDGIFLGDNSGSSTASRTKILNNTVGSNTGVGIRLNHSGTGVIEDTIVANNTVVSNGGGGILVQVGDKTNVIANQCISNTGTGMGSSGTDTIFVSNISLGNTVEQFSTGGTRTIEIGNIKDATGLMNSSTAIQSEDSLRVFKTSGNNADVLLQQSGVVNWTMRNVATTGTLDMLFGSESALRLQTAPSDGNTSLMVYRNVGGTMSIQQISMGAADSGGTGYKLLRVPN